MEIKQEVTEEIVRRILQVADPDRIIIFGSAASGSMTRDSDIDLLVLEHAPADPRGEMVRIWDALRGMGYAFDVIVMDTQWYEGSKNVVGGLAYPASRQGKVIYEAR
ncbi:MAG: nucleotidyltransferase domain-containing protein [Armatimonadota bacterium]